MKVSNRTIIKVLLGKMAEAIELKKEMAIWSGLVEKLPTITRYYPLTGGDDSPRTVITHQEWDSLATRESAAEKASASPEMRELTTQRANVFEDYRVKFYIEMR
jgi:hypothetical protein